LKENTMKKKAEKEESQSFLEALREAAQKKIPSAIRKRVGFGSRQKVYPSTPLWLYAMRRRGI
jgi:hypothetical protein